MSFLDRFRRKPPKTSSRYSLEDLAKDMYFNFGGHSYPLGMQTTWPRALAEPIGNDFIGYAQGALKSNGIISAIEMLRLSVFSEMRFQFQQLRARPGDLFGTSSLDLLERPWRGGTTGDLLSRMLLDADLAGNAYVTVIDGEVVRLRPDWVEIVLEARRVPRRGIDGEKTVTVGMRRVGYMYYENGRFQENEPAVFAADEVAHFAPYPDPEATYRGMSWLTPVLREIKSDKSATLHKLRFFENAATPNLAVSLAKEITPDQFSAFVEEMDRQHKGAENAYKTLYTAGGADVTVIGANLQQLDFKVTQGAGETRIAAAAGVHPVILGLSEGLAGSSLNAGNYGQAKRRFSDGTMRPLWRNVCGSLEVLVRPPSSSRLWFDVRDVSFLREDAKDEAEIAQVQASTVSTLITAGYDPASAQQFIITGDWSVLKHTGLVSVQLLPPGTTDAKPDPIAEAS